MDVSLFSINHLLIKFKSSVLIHGASGKRKTTLLHLLAGLFLADEGDVLLGASNLSILFVNERAEIRKNNQG
ncbi:MAG: hypothetical protein HQK53_05100 [Oligoflexia bacterium]|nr:hypothetical protein [Oligoflexia bacterium]